MHSVCTRERAEWQYVARSQPTAVVAPHARVRKEPASPKHAGHIDAALEGEDAEALSVCGDRAGLAGLKPFGGAAVEGEARGVRDLERHRAENLKARGVRIVSDGKSQGAKA